MKFVYALSFILTLAVAKAYDEGNFDIAGTINDDAKLKVLVGCILDTAPCDSIPEFPASFKPDLMEAFQTDCIKCTDTQKKLFSDFLTIMKDKFPTELEAIIKKYDPEGKLNPALLQ